MRVPTEVAAPHTYGGSIITGVTLAEPRSGDPRRPRNFSVPSYRPRQRAGSTRRRCPVSARRGCGAAHAGRWRQAPQKTGASAEVSAKRRAQGLVPSRHCGVHGRKAGRRMERLFEGHSLGCPVRLQAPPRPSLLVGKTSPYRTPPGV